MVPRVADDCGNQDRQRALAGGHRRAGWGRPAGVAMAPGPAADPGGPLRRGGPPDRGGSPHAIPSGCRAECGAGNPDATGRVRGAPRRVEAGGRVPVMRSLQSVRERRLLRPRISEHGGGLPLPSLLCPRGFDTSSSRGDGRTNGVPVGRGLLSSCRDLRIEARLPEAGRE